MKIDEITERIKELNSHVNVLENCGDEKQINDLYKIIALTYNERGHHYYKSVAFKDAINDFSHALSYDNRLAVAYYNRATIYYRLSNYKCAFLDIEKAIRFEPNNQEFKSAFCDIMQQYNGHK